MLSASDKEILPDLLLERAFALVCKPVDDEYAVARLLVLAENHSDMINAALYRKWLRDPQSDAYRAMEDFFSSLGLEVPGNEPDVRALLEKTLGALGAARNPSLGTRSDS